MSWVEARRRRRITLKALYLRGLQVKRVGKEQGGEDDDGASFDAENSCSEEEMVGVRTANKANKKRPHRRRGVLSNQRTNGLPKTTKKKKWTKTKKMRRWVTRIYSFASSEQGCDQAATYHHAAAYLLECTIWQVIYP